MVLYWLWRWRLTWLVLLYRGDIINNYDLCTGEFTVLFRIVVGDVVDGM